LCLSFPTYFCQKTKLISFLLSTFSSPSDLSSGATKGIGRAIALDLSTRGCSILGTYSSPQSAHNFDVLSHTVSALYAVPSSNPDTPNPDAPTLQGVAADITSLPSIEDVLTALGRYFTDKKIDILVLNAAHNTRPKLGSASEADITNSLTANLQWPILLVENLVRRKLFNNNSRLALLSSDRVRDPSPGASIFNATKAGLESLARSWALELPLTFPGTTVSHV
jgi:3-oxoacyl-[acyl-carrier protein] reductase